MRLIEAWAGFPIFGKESNASNQWWPWRTVVGSCVHVGSISKNIADCGSDMRMAALYVLDPVTAALYTMS